jgi:hypothetical protein
MGNDQPFYKKINLKCFSHAIGVAVVIILILWGILFSLDFFEQKRDMIMFFGFAATTIAILVAVLQNIKIHDWNRRQAATLALKEFKEKIKPHAKTLDEAFGYFLRDENSQITKENIHDAICKKDADGKFCRCDKTGNLVVDPEKSEISVAIQEYLNYYENIASGVHQGVYDKEVVADLIASSIIKVANLFDSYIKHFNDDMYPSSKGRVWLNIKTLGREFKKKYRGADNLARERDRT